LEFQVRPFKSWLETEDGLVEFRDQMIAAMPRPVKTSKDIDIDMPSGGTGKNEPNMNTGAFFGKTPPSTPSEIGFVPGYSDAFSSHRGPTPPAPYVRMGVNSNSSKSPYFTSTVTPQRLFPIFGSKPLLSSTSNNHVYKKSPIVFDDDENVNTLPSSANKI